jgi:hypothetical protein
MNLYFLLSGFISIPFFSQITSAFSLFISQENTAVSFSLTLRSSRFLINSTGISI